ncbi:MAG: 2OG-Fe(II) oxygenase [Acidobacteria bacterium]|nr:2OG-Fe(II) oxygenase [Acidobacteriota bacterium]
MEQERVEDAIEKLLESVDRPGDFCTNGRLFAPMPRLEVEGAGALAFPVPEAQIRALIRAAERAPYGRGTKTLVDRSVRDCWQIEPERVRLAGAAWRKTFAGILGSAAAGLGCEPGRLVAQLHKLLIYEPGGFFAPHHDTEKADGMVATLSISLPAAGGGGELVVRHRDRARTIDMTAAEPSELAFAAFYADCTHEVRPLTEGHRLSLVFNLCLRAGDTDTRREAPDYTAEVDRLAERLAEWGRARDATDKLVWLLDHEYSEAGLSFDALKNTDAAVARVLARAAERAACELRAAIVHIEEYGTPAYEDYDWDEEGMYADDDIRLEEVDDRRQWLDGWVDPGGGQPPFGEIELRSEELLPRGALDGVPPDEQEVHEASGNAGVSVERAYRRAAFVLWPRSKAVAILARDDVAGAVAWVAADLQRNAAEGGERARERTAQLIDAWPTGPYDQDGEGRARMLRLLSATGDEAQAARFLRRVVLPRYDGSENEALAVVVDMIGPSASRPFLLDLIGAHLRRRPTDILALLRCLDETRDDASGAAWDGALRAAVRAVLQALPAALPPPRERHNIVPSIQRLARLSDESLDDILDDNETEPGAGKRPARFGDDAVHDLFTLALRRGTAAGAEGAAVAVAALPAAVTPDRTLPAALGRLHAEEGAAGSGAFALLWRHAADFLLARSAKPPEEPSDWVIGANVGCRCEHCQRLRAFCKDPAARTARFPLRKELRAHLHQTIDRRGLDIEHVTERRGRPFTLVCTKTRATYRRRLAEYALDVSCMRRLAGVAPVGAHAARCAPDVARLREAAAASERG